MLVRHDHGRERRGLLWGYISCDADSFDYQECGPSFLIVLKLLRQTAARIKAKGRVCMSYAYNSKIFRKKQYQQFLRSEDVVNFEIT